MPRKGKWQVLPFRFHLARAQKLPEDQPHSSQPQCWMSNVGCDPGASRGVGVGQRVWTRFRITLGRGGHQDAAACASQQTAGGRQGLRGLESEKSAL